jgi:hypothetical protein
VNEPTLADMFLAIVPLLAVIGVAWYFVHLLSVHQKKMGELLQRQSDALERIAAALEKRG